MYVFVDYFKAKKCVFNKFLLRLSATKNHNDWPKPPFCIQQFSSHCILKLTSASPLTNSCSKQKRPRVTNVSLFLCPFLPGLICMSIFTLRGFTWLPAWIYVTICDISSLGAAMPFPVDKKILHAEHLCWGEWLFSSQFSLQFAPKEMGTKRQLQRNLGNKLMYLNRLQIFSMLHELEVE